MERRISWSLALVVVSMAVLGSATWLMASCTVDETTMTVFRQHPAGECREYVDASCFMLRAATADGDTWCQNGTTVQWWNWNCYGCHCGGQVGVRWCDSGGQKILGTDDEVTKYRCEWVGSDPDGNPC